MDAANRRLPEAGVLTRDLTKKDGYEVKKSFVLYISFMIKGFFSRFAPFRARFRLGLGPP